MSDETNAESVRPHGHSRILWGLLIGAVLGLIVNQVMARPAVPVAATVVNEAAGSASPPATVDPLRRIAESLIVVAETVGKVFLRMMFMVVVPLVFSALALAVREIGDVRQLGRLGLSTLGYTALLSLTAVLIGLVLVNTVRPGASLSEERRQELVERYQKGAKDKVDSAHRAKSLQQTLVDLLPENPLQEMVGAVDGSSKGNGMLAVMVFALIVGVCLTIEPEKTKAVAEVLEGLQAIAMTVISFAMRCAPVGAGCLVFAAVSQLGWEILRTLLWFVGTVIAGLAIHLFVTYSAVLLATGARSPLVFFRSVRDAMAMAFGTSSSSATLPTAMRVATDELKLSSRVANFVLTVGATGNQNGTALFEGTVVLFLAQVTNVDLTIGQQIQVVLMSILAGVGTAGVPGGSLPLIVVVMESVGVPGAAIGIVLGVDRLLDMCRTVVNVTGDLVIATCVDHGDRSRSTNLS